MIGKGDDSVAAPLTIVFFGLGAVGASMLICFAELAERDGVQARFRVLTIDPAAAQDSLYHAEQYLPLVELIGVESFEPIFAREEQYFAMLQGATLMVNASMPEFNLQIMDMALVIGAHTLDLATEMYDDETSRTLTFSQYKYDDAFRNRGIAALVNMGISPGVTNFLIGEHIRYLKSTGRKELEIESVDLYLLEDIDSESVLFSWSPATAIEEMSQQPRQLVHGKMVTYAPFAMSCEYVFPHEQYPRRQYPLYQEEVLSLHRTFPEIKNIRVYSGGNEVELIKALYQLNLFSRVSVGDNQNLTVDEVVRSVLPKMKKPRRIEDLLRSGAIRRAHFCAAAEIRVSEFVRNERQTSLQTVGVSYLNYRGLLGTPYAGATYVSYSAAVGATILAWHTLSAIMDGSVNVSGVITGEELAMAFSHERINSVRRDLVAWDINLFESVRDAESEG